MADYLDKNGLSHLWGMIKTYVTNTVKVTGVKGNAESTYRTGNVNLTAANVGAVATSGNETVSGNKTFTGTTTIEAASVVRNQVGQVIVANANAVIQSPIPKYIWHDVLAFNRATTPKYYTTSDGTTWTEATLDKRLFIHKEAWGKINILDSSISGSRWAWIGGGLAYCSATWLVIGVAYANPISKFNVLLETSSGSDDSATWTTLVDVSGISVNQNPIWIRTNTTSTNNIRLTITRNSESASTTTLPVTSIRWLTTRWGDQGKGSEFEYPYQWNENNTIFPITNNESDLGGTSYKWKNLFATTLNASSMGNNTKLLFPQTSGSDTGIEVTNAANSLGILFGIGSGQSNRGVYDRKLSKWLIHADNSNVYLNGTVVPSSPKFTDTVTTVTTTGSGNAITGITASNGALTATKGSTFLTQHQNAISGVNSNYTEDGMLYQETVDAPLPQSNLDLSSHNNIIATSLSAGSTGSVNMYLDLAVYGTCSTAASTAAKVVSGIKGFALATGSIVAVKFINTNTATPSTLTLNVNSTGAKSIKYRGAAIPSANRLSANRLYWFAYDGTNYEIIGDLDTTYSSMTQAEATQGTIATARLISPAVLKTTIANAVGDAGGGDMTKAVYDTNNNGKVDNADNSVKWNGISTDFQTDYTSILSNDADLMIAGYPYSQYDYNHKPTSLSSILATVTPSTDAIARYDVNSRLHSAAPVATSNDTTVATTAFVNTAIANAQSTITDITSEFTSSNSRIVVRQAYKSGKTVTVRFDVTRTSSIANGADIQAQITSQYLPLLTETSTRMWGSGFLIATFVGKDGVVNQTSDTHDQGYLWFRNSSGSSISKSSTVTLPITITYIYDDGTIS